VAWLLQRQRPDGAFPAPDYGVLRAAHSTTALAVLALARLRPRTGEVDAACARGLAFLRRNGVAPAQAVDYPCYTAAYWIMAATELGPSTHAGDLEVAVRALRRCQLATERGWRPEDPEFGGFGYGVDTSQRPAEADSVGLSTTSVAVRALIAAGVAPADPALVAARVFVERCQVVRPGDPEQHGGFVHRPGEGPLASKAGSGPRGPRPYASTTCDGLLALAALGEARSEHADAARRWLECHAVPPVVAGFEASETRAQALEPGLRLYALAALAAALPLVPQREHAWAAAIAGALRSRQRDDGAVVGWSPLFKEDDPMVGTLLAVLAFGAVEGR